MDAAVVMPYWGEFGCLVTRHIRWVNTLNCPNIVVCCRRGEESLYPNANQFFYDWPEGVGDKNCWEDGVGDEDLTREIIQNHFPNHHILKGQYNTEWAREVADKIKFRPKVDHKLKEIDIAMCARWRPLGPERNWQHWQDLINRLHEKGQRIGLVGLSTTSANVGPVEAYGWSHGDGPTAGTVDLLSNCRLYVGGDTGVSHLAAMMDVPMIIVRPDPHLWDWTPMMQKSTNNFIKVLSSEDSANPEAVIEAIIGYLK